MDKWGSTDLESLRQQFLNNEQPKLCQRCWDEESNGKLSLRQRLQEYKVFQTISVDQVLKDYKKGPRVLSIKNGNLCNARCRSCHPEDSTPWIQDSRKLNALTGKTFYKLDVSHSNWSDKQIQNLRSMASNLQRLELFGGEPLYNNQVIKLLDYLIQDGESNHIDLYINTNGSVDILDKIPFVTEFRSIDIGVSVDALPEHFSYVRHPLEFDVVANNIRKWKKHFATTGVEYQIQAIVTVSIFNVYYLLELKQQVEQLFECAPFWNLLVDPEHLDIANMPREVKQAVIKRIEHDPEFAQFVNVMQHDYNPTAWERFFTICDGLDNIRNEQFSNVFPEFANIVNQHRPKNKVVIFIGDLSQSYQGQYLVSLAQQHDKFSVQLSEDDVLHPGTYFTGPTLWKDYRKLKQVLSCANEVYYAPPKFWSDGVDYISKSEPLRGWSADVIENALRKIPYKKWLTDKS